MNQDISILLSQTSIIVFVLVLSRIGGMLATAPFFSTFPIPMQVKAGLAALTAFMIYPMVMQNSHLGMPSNLVILAVMVFKEIFVGVLIGFCSGLIFVGIQMAGFLLSMQMGLSVGNVLDPVTNQQVPIIGQFYLFLASMVFLLINGHQWLFTSIYDSYHAIPIGLDFGLSAEMVQKVIYITSQLFTIAFKVIMPIFGVLFILDIALGFMSKVMPQMNVFMVAIPIKIYAGLILMIIFMTKTATYLQVLISTMFDSIRSIFT